MEGTAKREQKVGDFVQYVDETGVPHNAMVTAWWSETCCNVVLISGDPEKKDTYGRQIERRTSLLHKDSPGAVFGNYWKWPDEPLTPKSQPTVV